MVHKGGFMDWKRNWKWRMPLVSGRDEDHSAVPYWKFVSVPSSVRKVPNTRVLDT